MLSTFSWSLQTATRTLAHAQSPPSTLGMYTAVLKPCAFQGTRWMRTPPDADGGCYYKHTSFAVLVVFMVPSRWVARSQNPTLALAGVCKAVGEGGEPTPKTIPVELRQSPTVPSA